ATNDMLKEGTINLLSAEISEKLDFYGAFVYQAASKDSAQISLFTLKKYLSETIEIFEEIIKKPTFPNNEFSKYITNKRQNFKLEQSKVISIARNKFYEQIFSPKNQYGKSEIVADFDNIGIDDLKTFHAKYYTSNNCKIIMSGKVNSIEIDLINTKFGGNDWKGSEKFIKKEANIKQLSNKLIVENKANAVQSAIYIGKNTINKYHSDYIKLKVVSTILGGYFSSRLMRKIREEKGYTYGISSILMSYQQSGMFAIVSEVGVENTKNAVSDIIIEITKLRKELVPNDELNLVKNYLLGNMLRMFDGPFAISSAYKSLIEFNLDVQYFENAFKVIKSITSEEVNNIANKYLHEDDMVKIVAGKY
ncbi:MAG: pitrilysin family protein, partial [Bacteroidota bacterium]|nr:pitrilysin family protein [Bacteroidota bacterium]